MFALTLEGVYKNIEFMIDQYKKKDASAKSQAAAPNPSGTVYPYQQLDSVETGSSSSSIAWVSVLLSNTRMILSW